MRLHRLNLIAQALADPTRVRLLAALRQGELCACQLIELVELAPSTVSQHLACLKYAGLISARKQGRWMHYRLTSEDEDSEAAAVIQLISNMIESDAQLSADQKRIDQICTLTPDDLCTLQRNGVSCCSPPKTIKKILSHNSRSASQSARSKADDATGCACS